MLNCLHILWALCTYILQLLKIELEKLDSDCIINKHNIFICNHRDIRHASHEHHLFFEKIYNLIPPLPLHVSLLQLR